MGKALKEAGIEATGEAGGEAGREAAEEATWEALGGCRRGLPSHYPKTPQQNHL